MRFNSEKMSPIEWDYSNSPRSPDRIWQRVRMMVHRSISPNPPTPENDQFVQEVVRVLSIRNQSIEDRNRKQKSKQKPDHSTIKHDILEAIELGLAESGTADLIRAYVLADQPPQTIADLVGRRIEVVDNFERLFFDVRRRLDAWGWVQAFVIVPAFHLLDQLDPTSDEFAVARDRAVVLNAAYSFGNELLKRIVQPARFLAKDSQLSPLLDSPTTRILKWSWTSDQSLEFDMKVLVKIETLFGNSNWSEMELDERLEVIEKMINQNERKRSVPKKRPQPSCSEKQTMSYEGIQKKSQTVRL